eukprot:COSAG05_NODE_1363_length_5081_cov_1.577479_3_plen_101_part_00
MGVKIVWLFCVLGCIQVLRLRSSSGTGALDYHTHTICGLTGISPIHPVARAICMRIIFFFADLLMFSLYSSDALISAGCCRERGAVRVLRPAVGAPTRWR